MLRLYGSLRTLGFWQVSFLVVVLFGAAAGVYYGYEWSRESVEPLVAEDQQIVPITYGDLVRQVTTSGSLEFPERETLSFDIGGTIGSFAVEEGQRVTAGQEIASLDDATVIALQENIAQARVDLDDARDASDELLEEPTKLDYAQAKADIAAAQLALEDAIGALEDAIDTLVTQKEIRDQETIIAQAKLDIQNAEAALADLVPESDGRADAVLAEADAELELDEAESVLERFDLAHQTDLAEAEKDLNEAESSLVDAEAELETYETNNELFLGPALRELEEATENLEETLRRLGNLRSYRDEGQRGLDLHILRLESHLEIRQERYDDAREPLLELERLQAVVGLAQTGFAQADADLTRLRSGPDAMKRSQLQAAIDVAVNNLVDAEADLAELAEEADQGPIADKLLAIGQARIEMERPVDEGNPQAAATKRATLQALELGLAGLRAGADPVSVALLEAELVQAWAALGQAEQDFVDMFVEPDALTVALREREIEVAKVELDEAIQALADLDAEPDSLEIALHQAKIVSAGTGLAQALAELDQVVLLAPSDGEIVELFVEAGDSIEPGAQVVELLDTSVVEMAGIVDEIDILSVSVDMAALVMLDALPGRTLAGIVTHIDDGATNQQGVVTYEVRIDVETPQDVQLIGGLSAVAILVLEREENVLLVPQQAIAGSFQAPVVRVLTESGIEDRAVSLGSSDDFWTVVESGLNEGDRVVMQAAQSASDIFGSFRSFNVVRPAGGPTRR